MLEVVSHYFQFKLTQNPLNINYCVLLKLFVFPHLRIIP